MMFAVASVRWMHMIHLCLAAIASSRGSFARTVSNAFWSETSSFFLSNRTHTIAGYCWAVFWRWKWMNLETRNQSKRIKWVWSLNLLLWVFYLESIGMGRSMATPPFDCIHAFSALASLWEFYATGPPVHMVVTTMQTMTVESAARTPCRTC